MGLTEHDKQLISCIDNQVSLLLARHSSDMTILNTMAEFLPDLRCLLNSTETTELNLYLNAYPGCAYLLSVVS